MGSVRAGAWVGLDRAVTANEGVALIVVLWMVMVLSLLISGFAFTMQVESQVASLGRKQLKAELLARSGVELVRMQLLLGAQAGINHGFDALNQDWATNETWYVNHVLGDGVINVKVIDEERKLPINRASPEQLKRLLDLVGVDPSDSDVIVDSILDWIQPGDLHRLNGAKDDYYLNLSPPYHCKGAPLDRVEELLLVRGVTPELLRGAAGAEDEDAHPGLAELVTTTSSGQVNVNTASAMVLKTLLGLDDARAEAVLSRRDGPDGVAGTEDDQPYRNVGEFMAVVGALPPSVQAQAQQVLTVNSTFFTVIATGEVGNVKRQVIAILRRNAGVVTVASWREQRVRS